MTEQVNVEELWAKTRQMLEQGDINPPLWEAAATVQPITLDEDTLVLGLPAVQMRHASYLETAINKSRLQQILESLTGQRLDLRVIEGTTAQDWERIKQRQQISVDATVARVRAQAAGRGTVATWQEGAKQVAEMLSGTRARARSIDLAQLLVKTLPQIWEIEQTARQQDPDNEDVHSQQLDRIVERVATYCNLPAPVVALEYLRYRSAKDKAKKT